MKEVEETEKMKEKERSRECRNYLIEEKEKRERKNVCRNKEKVESSND